MTRPRSALVSLADTPWYHCVSRCGRRAYLCGDDAASGKSFEHRRGWIVSRIKELAAMFAIDVAAYAVMSNHYHLVLRVDMDRAAAWSDEEVLQRWTQIFAGPLLVQRFVLPQIRGKMGSAELAKVAEMAATYRERLADLSWFMRRLNESVARMANAEDGCTGRFWEGRFKSQALLDEKAVLTAMAYVDLNPVRAGMAETPEESDHTSIQERLRQTPGEVSAVAQEAAPVEVDVEKRTPAIKDDRMQAALMPFDALGEQSWAIPFGWQEYAELVDWTGRQVRSDKSGHIAAEQPAILNRLGLEGDAFVDLACHLLQRFGVAVGAPPAMARACARRQRRFLHGQRMARRLETLNIVSTV